eukprot:SAG31_NODE_11609_length_1013_cov_4.615974_2_plen_127_part_00
MRCAALVVLCMTVPCAYTEALTDAECVRINAVLRQRKPVDESVSAIEEWLEGIEGVYDSVTEHGVVTDPASLGCLKGQLESLLQSAYIVNVGDPSRPKYNGPPFFKFVRLSNFVNRKMKILWKTEV